MSAKVEPGTYQCKTTAATIYEAPSGAVMCRIGVAIDIPMSQYGGIEVGQNGLTQPVAHLTGGICLIQKDGTLSERGFKDAAAILGIEGGWNWDAWGVEPEYWAGHDVEAVIETVQGEKGEFSSVKYLNPPGGGSARMEKADAKGLAAKYGAKTRALFGGAPAKPAPPAAKAPPPPKPAGKTATIEEAWAKWGKPDDVDGFYALAQRVTGKADHNDVGPDGWAAVIEAMSDNLPY